MCIGRELQQLGGRWSLDGPASGENISHLCRLRKLSEIAISGERGSDLVEGGPLSVRVGVAAVHHLPQLPVPRRARI